MKYQKGFTILELIQALIGAVILGTSGFVAFLVVKILWNLAF